MGLDELLRLDEHAAGTAAGVVHLAVMGGENGHQGPDDAGGAVELTAPLPLGAGELTEKILVHLAQDVAGALPGDN